jgi:prepilin-type N-terminal cleavage/methylation domain-containing protein
LDGDDTVHLLIKNKKGMTLIEIMMAVAVFGILLATSAQVYAFVTKYDSETVDQMKMSEIARAELERIKGGGYATGTGKVVDGFVIEYDPEITEVSGQEPQPEPGTIYKILVCPSGITPNPENSDTLILAGWVPPKVAPVIYIPSDSPADPTEPAPSQPYAAENWIYDNYEDYSQNDGIWNVDQEGISRVSTSAGQGNSDEFYLYYKEPFTDFDFIVYPEYSKLKSNSPTGHKGTGITFKTKETDVNLTETRYDYYMYERDGNFNLRLEQDGTEVFDIPTSISASTNQKYYIRATHSEGTLTLDFGTVDADNNISRPEQLMPTVYDNFLDTSKEYLVGLYDSTANDINSTFQLQSASGGTGEDCGLH